jgi:hypothetical protein
LEQSPSGASRPSQSVALSAGGSTAW